MKPCVAVTGVNGYLGFVLAQKLVQLGYRVKGLIHTHFHSDLEKLEIDIVYGDINDPSSLEPLCKDCEVVFHAASYITIVGHEDDTLKKVNVEGTQNIVHACMKYNCKLVYISSVEAIGKQAEREHTEDDGFNEHCALIRYGWSKALASKLVLDACKNGLDASLICPTGIFGPFDYGSSKLGIMVRQFMAKTLIAYPASGGFCFVDVRDVANAAISAATHAKPASCYILSAEYLEVADIMEMLEKITGIRKPRMKVPLWFINILAYIIEPICRVLRLDPIFTKGSANILRSKLRVRTRYLEADLGIVPRPIAQSLEDQVSWYKGLPVALD